MRTSKNLPIAKISDVCLHSGSRRGFFEGVRTPSNATAYLRDPPRNTKEPEPSIGTPARRGNERAPSTAEDEALWLKRIAEIDLKQERLLDLRLDGDITPEQFRARSKKLKDARVAAQDQLEASRSRLSRLKDLERSKDTLVSHYASLVPVGLNELHPADRNKVCEMMHLRDFAHPDDTLIVEWGCNVSPLPPGSFKITTPSFEFRALLTEGADPRVQLHRA
jgi:hypothetical protein